MALKQRKEAQKKEQGGGGGEVGVQGREQNLPGELPTNKLLTEVAIKQYAKSAHGKKQAKAAADLASAAA